MIDPSGLYPIGSILFCDRSTVKTKRTDPNRKRAQLEEKMKHMKERKTAGNEFEAETYALHHDVPATYYVKKIRNKNQLVEF